MHITGSVYKQMLSYTFIDYIFNKIILFSFIQIINLLIYLYINKQQVKVWSMLKIPIDFVQQFWQIWQRNHISYII